MAEQGRNQVLQIQEQLLIEKKIARVPQVHVGVRDGRQGKAQQAISCKLVVEPG